MENEHSPELHTHSPPSENSAREHLDLSCLFDSEDLEVFSEASILYEELSPYLEEYPFLRGNVEVLSRLRTTLNTPLDIPKKFYSTGIYGAGDAWAEGERDRQIREILEEAKLKLTQEDNQGSE